MVNWSIQHGEADQFITNYIYISLGKFHHDLTVLPNPGIIVSKGNHPQMAELFRLVKYGNFPRYIHCNCLDIAGICRDDS